VNPGQKGGARETVAVSSVCPYPSPTPAPAARFPFALVETEALWPHEQVDQEHFRRLLEDIRGDGVLFRPVLVDRRSLVILDGHHRVSALRRMGCRLTPAYLVDYADGSIEVFPRRRDIPVTKEDVIRMGLLGTLYPPQTSRHVLSVVLAPRPVRLADLGRL